MIAYNNPQPLLLTNPVGIDLEVQKIQIKLQSDVSWLQTVHGRAHRQEASDVPPVANGKKETFPPNTYAHRIYYPEVYTKGMEPFNCMPNDNLKAQSFFYTQDPTRPVSYEPNQRNSYTCRTSLVVMMNLKKIDASKDWRYTENLKADVLDVMRKMTSARVVEIFDGWEDVLVEYTITENNKLFMKLPYQAFRIDFDLSYTERQINCI